MRVQHNIPAMNAYRNYTSNVRSVAKNLEKLSSGYRINRAGDDAAGLAISEKMRAQITGLSVAQKNAKDGISLVQTAEGALTEVHAMLNRMFSLAEQSANGTYDNEVDRNNLQKEFNALRTEIDRIADASNFNGQKLLDGSLKTTSTTIAEAAKLGQVALTDGVTPAAATKASATIQLNGTTATTGIVITGGTSTVANLGALTAGTTALSALFDLKVNGLDLDWTSDAGTTIASGATIELTAKNGGELATGVMTALNAIGGATSLEVVAGKNEGAGTAATAAQYDLAFDFTKIAGGQTFTIGDKTFEISTSGGAVGTGNVAIDLSGLDLGVAGASNAAGQWGAAAAIRTAVNTAMSGTFDVAATPAAAPTGGKYTLSLTANSSNLGEAGNLGVVRVSQSAAGAIASTYTLGEAEGAANPGKFATATYDLDLSKLKAGDELVIGGKTISVVADDAATVEAGQIKLADAKDGAKLATAFETAGFAAGKVSFAAGKVTITDSVVGNKGTALAAGDGKVVLKAGQDITEVTGGLTLQIGDTADTYNTLTVGISDMHAAALELDSLNIGEQGTSQAAMDSIKNAINSVSSTRGDLGALQNRLEHTINNLGVMQENIQDAESTIRDTDIAEEMMAYTKNNILVQSAQAMLAQANQLPQGVLQLLG